MDILDRREHGQNIYHLTGNRLDLVQKQLAQKQKIEKQDSSNNKNEKKEKVVGVSMKTIPNSNLK